MPKPRSISNLFVLFSNFGTPILEINVEGISSHKEKQILKRQYNEREPIFKSRAQQKSRPDA